MTESANERHRLRNHVSCLSAKSIGTLKSEIGCLLSPDLIAKSTDVFFTWDTSQVKVQTASPIVSKISTQQRQNFNSSVLIKSVTLSALPWATNCQRTVPHSGDLAVNTRVTRPRFTSNWFIRKTTSGTAVALTLHIGRLFLAKLRGPLIRTGPITRPFCTPRWHGAAVGWCWQGKTKELVRKPVPVSIRPQQIPHSDLKDIW